jgi:hypothetical protein
VWTAVLVVVLTVLFDDRNGAALCAGGSGAAGFERTFLVGTGKGRSFFLESLLHSGSCGRGGDIALLVGLICCTDGSGSSLICGATPRRSMVRAVLASVLLTSPGASRANRRRSLEGVEGSGFAKTPSEYPPDEALVSSGVRSRCCLEKKGISGVRNASALLQRSTE